MFLRKRRVRKALERLTAHDPSSWGGSSDTVAHRLQEAGIVGIPEDAEECPVARYVHQQTGFQVVVDSNLVLVARVPGWTPNEVQELLSVVMPPAVRIFIRNFDNLRYPTLIDRWRAVSDETTKGKNK